MKTNFIKVYSGNFILKTLALFVVAVAVLCVYGVEQGFAAKKDISGICYQCHAESEKNMNKAVKHKPVSEGRCSACHNPHVSSHSNLMSGVLADVCYECHNSKKFIGEKFVHEPVKSGECSVCHEPHSSSRRGLLTKSKVNLCYDCHKKDDIVGGKYVHPEVKK
ncbi:MAG: hypothetical protein KAR06_04495, partial [Deltaproteobacteria bacterium]|nr:hypothetical protein [Deltaproteobacteria bacterium]